MTHTPGPWQYACDSGGSTPCLGKVRHSKKACVYQTSGMKTIASHVEKWSDARLIAAAPDLLFTLRALCSHFPDPLEHGTGLAHSIHQARTAIAKAEKGGA